MMDYCLHATRAGVSQMSSVPIAEWERAEIVRSDSEAAATVSLRLGKRNLARYLAPPAASPYPLEHVFHLLGNVQGLRVLDIGCGSGVNTLLVAFRGARAFGVDISEALVNLGVERFRLNPPPRPPKFIVGSAHSLPVRDESLDVVIGIAVLHHLDLDRAIQELHRILKPGGRAILQEPVRDSWLMKLARRAFPNTSEEVSPFERPLTSAEIQASGRRFARMTMRYFCLPHVRLGERLRLSEGTMKRLYALDSWMLRRWRRLERLASIGVIELAK